MPQSGCATSGHCLTSLSLRFSHAVGGIAGVERAGQEGAPVEPDLPQHLLFHEDVMLM